MRRTSTAALLVALAAAGAGLPALIPAASAAPSAGQPASPIKHIVIILKENRSFDNYFGQLPGVNGATTAVRSDGTTVPLARTPDVLPHDIRHTPQDFLIAYDGGRNDRFDKEGGAYTAGPGTAPLALSQFTRADIPAYYRYAQSYGIADRFFASWRGASFANNLYEISGQAGRYDTGSACVPNPASPGTSACRTDGRTVYHLPHTAANPHGNSPHWGCDAGPTVTVPMMSALTGKVDAGQYPCFRFPTLPNLLTKSKLSWKLYSDASRPKHDALEAITSIRNNASEWARVQPLQQFTTDATSGTLPSVSWVVSKQDEHPPESVCLGENETVNDVNAVMSTSQWKSTAVLVVWDEWGGFYDHVAPPQIDKVSFGFRVPFLAISPWVKKVGTVDSNLNSHASILKFVEANFHLPNLGADDARSDTGSNLMSMFDFSSPHAGKVRLTPRGCAALTPAQQALVDSRDDD